MTPAKYNFTDRYKNDTSNAVQFTVTKKIDSVDTAIDLTGVLIKMQLKKGIASTVSEKTFEVGSGITLTNASGGIFTIDTFTITLNAYNYFYDLQLTFTDGTINTYLKGNFKVVQDTTQ